MEIKKLLKIKTMGVTPVEANGALLSDVGTEYPVLLDSLINTVIFPQLQSSGYSLIALPYTFEKDGVQTTSLPVEDYTPTPEEEDNLYKLVGSKYNNGDLTPYLSKATVKLDGLPECKITIETREDFLKYLDQCSKRPEDVPLPLGYFVSQNALFTFEEYTDPINAEYVHIINTRHKMSYRSYLKLCVFFKQFGLSDTATYFDIVKKYMSWGLDGVRYGVINTNEYESYSSVYYQYIKFNDSAKYTESGFIDNKQNKYLSSDKDNKTWKIERSSHNLVMAKITPNANGQIMLPDNKLLLVDYEKPTQNKTVQVQCSGYTYTYDESYILINNERLEELLIISADYDAVIVPKECLGLNEEAMRRYYNWQYLYSIALYAVDRRIRKCSISSYQLLTMFNYTPVEALKYIALKAGYTPVGTSSDDMKEEPVFLPEDIYEAYVKDDWKDVVSTQGATYEEYDEILTDMVNGDINCDNIDAGMRADAACSPTAVFRELYAIHHALGFSLEEIYDRIKEAEVGKDITFERNGVSYDMHFTLIDGHFSGYRQDLAMYSRKAAAEAYTLLEVQKIFREVGVNDCRRHVGAAVLRICKTPKIQAIINMIKAQYAEQVETKVVSSVQRSQLHLNADIVANESLFKIYHTGEYQFPHIQDCPVFKAEQSVVSAVGDEVQFFVDSIQAFSAYSQQTSSTANFNVGTVSKSIPADYSFGIFVTNAFMCQERIIPRKGYTIPEVAFFAVWRDLRGKTAVLNTLIERDIIHPNHKAYKLSPGLAFLKYGDYPAENKYSLAHYEQVAMEDFSNYKADKSVTYNAVTHPLEYIYPNIYKKQEVVYLGDINEYPKFVLGFKRDVTREYFAEEVSADAKAVEKKGVYPFAGFAPDIFRLGLNTLSLVPEVTSAKQLIVVDNTFVTTDTQQTYDYTRMQELETNGYPVKHVIDNMYVARVGFGEVVEVFI